MKRLPSASASCRMDRSIEVQTISLQRKTDFSRGNTRITLKSQLLIRHTKISPGDQNSPWKDLDDSQLITVVHTQNREAYQELFDRYQKKLYTYIFHLVGNREEVEDILQNVFVKTYKNIEHFDISRKFSSWIYRIAHNEAVNFLKRKSKRYMVSWEDISTSKDKLETASNDAQPEDKWQQEETIKSINDALEKLPPKYQQVLKYRYFNEYSYEHISSILGKPVNTVGTLINRAKKKLLEVVKENEMTM